MAGKIKDAAREFALLALGEVALGIGTVLRWVLVQLEDEMGQKEDAALSSLDEALDRLADWQDAADETDAAAINERVRRINTLLPNAGNPLPGEVIDASTGQPVPVNADGPGPEGVPVTAEDPAAATADEEVQSS